jgi:predicted anti-sigma-YlaC factor YlaD
MAEKKIILPSVNEPKNVITEVGKEIMDTPGNSRSLSSKELLIAGGAVLVAAIIFFLVKNAVSKMLVANYRKSPRSAEMGGWALFCVLLLSSVAAALGALDKTRLFSLPYLIPIGVAMLASLTIFIIALMSKR